MKARGLTLVALLGAAFASPLAALDFGLDVINVSSFQYQDAWEFNQTDRATLWLSLPLTPVSGLYVSGLYEFTASFDPDGYTMVPWRLDIGRTEWEGNAVGAFGPSTSFKWSVGRIPLQDFSGRVLSSLVDGAAVEASFGNFSAAFSTAYSGLLNKNDIRMNLDADDTVRLSDDGVYFAPPRLLANLGVRFIEPLEGIDMGFQAWAQFDLDPEVTPTHTQYLEPYLDGRAGRSFRWRAWFILETGSDGEAFASLAGGGRGRWSFPELSGLRLTASMFWAAAATDSLRQFTPMSISPVAVVAPQSFADVTVVSADAALSPLGWATLGLNLSAFFRGDLSVAEPFVGYEAALSCTLKPVSDFSVDLSGGVYSPFQEGVPLKAMATLMASMKF